MVYNDVLEAVGHTPMIRLSERMVGKDSARVLVKYEGLNVGGSTLNIGEFTPAVSRLIGRETSTGNIKIGLRKHIAIIKYSAC